MKISYSITNQATGKEATIPQEMAEDFFGLMPNGPAKKIMCLPFSSETSIEANNRVYEVKEVKRKRKMPGTLVVRMGGLGDLILLTSGLRELQRRGEKLTVATLPQHRPFMATMGFNTISVADMGKFAFGNVIDLRFAVEPPELGMMCKGTWTDYTLQDRSDVFDTLLGIYPARKSFSVPVDGRARAKMLKLLKSRRDCKIVALNACIVAAARSIPQNYIEPMCELLGKAGLSVVLFGQTQTWNQGLKDINFSWVENLIDKTTTEEMIALCSMADMIIAPDSGPLHVGGALGVKTLGLFGNINPRTRISYYPSVRPLYPQGEIDCVPCWDLHPCSCDVGAPVRCMERLTPGRVVNAAKELGGY